MSVTLRRSVPLNIPANGVHSENDTVDFILTHEGESLELGSIRLEGELQIRNNNDKLTKNANEDKDIVIDRWIGAHAIVENIQTEISSGLIENVSHYGRYVKMRAVGEKSMPDLGDGSNSCELRAQSRLLMSRALAGVVPQNQPPKAVTDDDVIVRDPDFSFKPDIALNSRKGELPYRRTGDVRISVILNTNAGVTYGLDSSNLTTYGVKDLRLTYRTKPDDGSAPPSVELHSKIGINQSLQSNLANVQAQVPAVCRSVSCSFQKQIQINSSAFNNYTTEQLPQLESLQFLYNDSTNKGVSYLIRDNVDAVDRYIDSFEDTGSNNMSRNNQSNNEGYGIGLNFDDDIDLTRQKLNIQIKTGDGTIGSGIQATDPLVMYMYFHSVISV